MKLEEPAPTPYYTECLVRHAGKEVKVFCSYVSKEKHDELFHDYCDSWNPVMFAANRLDGKEDEFEIGYEESFCGSLILHEVECPEPPENVHVKFDGSGWLETGCIIRIRRDGSFSDVNEEDEEEEGQE